MAVSPIQGIPLGNTFKKYGTKDPLARWLLQNFLRTAKDLVAPLRADTILEVGCGEGYLSDLLRAWKDGARVCAADLSERIFDAEIRRKPGLYFSVQSAYQLAFPAESFDLVVGVEVLEHLEKPEEALREMQRVTRAYALLSMPREPLWRVLNVARLAYLKQLGNTLGHVQHWSSSAFVRLVAQYFDVVRVATPLPWTLLLARKK